MRRAIFFNIASLFLFTLLFSHPIYAHPGRTASDGCHYCKTNCDSWGVPWNERHCHGGSVQGIQESEPITPPTSTPVPLPTWTSIPTKIPTLTRTLIPTFSIKLTATPTSKVKAVRKSVVVKNTAKKQKKSFWQWLFGK